MTEANYRRPRKRFGQNFLIDNAIIDGIIAAINPGDEDDIVEIGPGEGALTKRLINRCHRLWGIEIDRDLAALLRDRYSGHERFNLICQDVLEVEFSQFQTAGMLRIAGNLPYNISTPLLFKLLTSTARISDMHFMLQKEVVDRLVAKAGEKPYGRLSVMVQYHCTVESLMTVPPAAFRPQPKVHSAVARLQPYNRPPFLAEDYAMFENLVNAAFQQRRKTLRNSLKRLLPAGAANLDFDLAARPEELSVEQFVDLANQMSSAYGRL